MSSNKNIGYKPKHKERSRNKIFLLIVLFIILIISLFFVYKSRSGLSHSNDQKGASSNSSFNAESNAKKVEPTNTQNTSSTNTEKNPNPSDIKVSIVNLSLNNSSIHIGNIVEGVTSGSCVVTGTFGSQVPINLLISDVTQNVNYYDCGIINIPESKLTQKGLWKITLTVSNNGESAEESRDVTIQ